MRFVVGFVAAVMLMGVVGCNTTPLPSEKSHYAWEIKVSRGMIDKKPVFYFNWVLNKVTGSKEEYVDSSNMVASYERAGMFSKKSNGKALKTTFTVKKGDNGTDIVTGNLRMIKPFKGKFREECWKLRRKVPANLKKPIVFRIPEESPKKKNVAGKTN